MGHSDRSFTNKVWNIKGNDIAYAHDVLSFVGVEIAYNRGCQSKLDIDHLLNQKINNTMPDPYILNDMFKATQRVCDAIRRRQRILVFGDYDVDGITATCIMVRFLRELGCDPQYFVPNRFDCGYGFNQESFSHIDTNVDLIIVVDSGTNAVRAVEIACDLGIDVIICDHHIQAVEILPQAIAVVNPNRKDQVDVDNIGIKNLCAAGVVFLLIVAVRRALKQYNIHLEKYISIVALGTLCDVMVLTGLNRAIVRYALSNPLYFAGLQAMLHCCGIENAQSADDFTFFVGPLINAAGRICDPTVALNILLQDDYLVAVRMTSALKELNQTRKDIEQSMFGEAVKMADKYCVTKNAICVYGNGWNAGVIGIVAGKLKEKYNKPAFVISIHGGIGKGSARSIPEVSLEHIFRQALASNLIIKGGGHAVAGGFEIHQDKIGAFEDFLETQCDYIVDHALYVDCVLTTSSDFDRILSDIKRLEPFGNGFHKPVFVFRKIKIVYTKMSNNEQHMTIQFKQQSSKAIMRAVIFQIMFKNALITNMQKNIDAELDLACHLSYSKDFGVSLIVVDIGIDCINFVGI